VPQPSPTLPIDNCSPTRTRRVASALSACAAFAILLAGCSGDKGGGAQTAAAAPANAGPAGGGSGGPGGAPTIVLSSTDVSTARRSSIEATTPITGDLRPVETVEVRARLEGDLVGVYAREGDRVRQGQLLARFEASEQESNSRSAEAERVAAEAALTTAQWNAEQSAELFKAGAIPERDNKVAEQEVIAAQARLAAAEAQVRSRSSFVTDTRVLSPVTGIVERRLVQDGERVAPGTAMFTVVRNEVLELAASVPGRQAGEIRAGQPVRFTADGRAFEGTVARVSPTIDPTTRALTVYIRIPNPGGTLKGNTFASGRIVGRTIDSAVVVPSSALRQSGEGGQSFVYRLAGQTVERAPVRLGVVDDGAGLAQVLEGVNEGDRVIVGNVGAIGTGMRVQVVGEGEGEER
jgi:RND family efflux transporter MFP subunit